MPPPRWQRLAFCRIASMFRRVRFATTVQRSLAGTIPGAAGAAAIVLDVAHNPHAARALAATLATMGYFGQTIAVFGMLADKDSRVSSPRRPRASTAGSWRSVPGPRGATADSVRAMLESARVERGSIATFDDVETAFAAAREGAGDADRIVVFGSFLTVAAALAAA
jgi:dihydrofolate synthase/folylpolyglutamate synthase